MFVVLTLAISIAAYFMSRSILINKYKELSSENLSYLLDITEKEMDELANNFDFISASEILQTRLLTDYSDLSNAQRMKDDVALTDLFINLSMDETFDAIRLIYINGSEDEDYWYGAGIDSIDQDKILTMLSTEPHQLGKLHYVGVGSSLDHVQWRIDMLRFTREMVNVERQIVGDVYFELDTSYFHSLYSSERLLTDTSLYLVDGDGLVLYSPFRDEVGHLYELELDHPDGDIIVSAQLEAFGWQLISVTPKSYITEDSNDIFRLTALVGGISIAIAFILIGIITNRFVKPISQLTTAVSEVTEGDFSVLVDHSSQDEIGELTDRFNIMTTRIQDNLNKEIAHNKAMNDAEYKALQAQINPHFMYNSLNTLKWIATIQKADSITNIVEALWTLLKKTSSLKGQSISLQSELEVIEAFVIILQARYNGKFQVQYEIPDDLLAWPIPKYILQPLVENAIFHGIEPKLGQGTVTISAYLANDVLTIEVRDDGVGIPVDQLKKLLTSDQSESHKSGLNNIGVKNVNDRLQLLYGHAYALKVDSTVGVGTVFTVKIPQMEEGEAHV